MFIVQPAWQIEQNENQVSRLHVRRLGRVKGEKKRGYALRHTHQFTQLAGCQMQARFGTWQGICNDVGLGVDSILVFVYIR